MTALLQEYKDLNLKLNQKVMEYVEADLAKRMRKYDAVTKDFQKFVD